MLNLKVGNSVGYPPPPIAFPILVIAFGRSSVIGSIKKGVECFYYSMANLSTPLLPSLRQMVLDLGCDIAGTSVALVAAAACGITLSGLLG